MPIQFLLRKYSNESLYSKALINLIKMQGNLLIVSTGFINNSNPTANDMAIKKIAKAINIRNSINKNIFEIIIVGGEPAYRSNYPNNFINFCNELYAKITDKSNIKIKFKRVIGDNWHGKVAIKIYENSWNFNNNIYYGAVLGSSNSTPVNILDNQFGWNKETDLYIVDGNLVADSNLNRIKGFEYNIKNCSCQIDKNIKKINDNIENILKNNIGNIGKIEVKNDETLETNLDTLLNKCKNYIVLNQDSDKGYLFYSILKCINEINNMNRIKNEIENSFNSMNEPWRCFKRETQSLVIEARQHNNYVAQRFQDCINNISRDIIDRQNISYYNFNNIYKEVKQLEKDYCNKEIWRSTFFSESYKKELKCFIETLNKIRKNLIVFRTIYDLKVDGAFIESIIKGIFIEVKDIIDNFTIEELSL